MATIIKLKKLLTIEFNAKRDVKKYCEAFKNIGESTHETIK